MSPPRRHTLVIVESGHKGLRYTIILIDPREDVLKGEPPERPSALSLVPFTLWEVAKTAEKHYSSRCFQTIGARAHLMTRPCTVLSVSKASCLLDPAGEDLAYLDPRTYIRGRATLRKDLLF